MGEVSLGFFCRVATWVGSTLTAGPEMLGKNGLKIVETAIGAVATSVLRHRAEIQQTQQSKDEGKYFSVRTIPRALMAIF